MQSRITFNCFFIFPNVSFPIVALHMDCFFLRYVGIDKQLLHQHISYNVIESYYRAFQILYFTIDISGERLNVSNFIPSSKANLFCIFCKYIFQFLYYQLKTIFITYVLNCYIAACLLNLSL